MPEKKGLSSTTVVFMIAVALFFDALQALLTPIAVGWFVPIVSYPTFWLWFKFHGLSFFSLKRAPTLGIGALIELIPGFNILPAFTFTVARIALKEKIQEEVAGKVPGGQMALNIAGNKAMRNRNYAQVDNMTKVKPMANNTAEKMQRYKDEAKKKYEPEAQKRREEVNKHYEDRRQEQRKFEEGYGGYQKYDKDLSELKYKYRNSSSSPDKAA